MIKVLPKGLSETMRLYPHCRRSSKSLEFYVFFGCYVTKWDHNLNNCWFVRLCLGFHGISSRKTFQAPAWHKSVRTQNNHHLYKHLEDERRIAKLAHMTDMFELLNEFNIKMQGKNENILWRSDKLKGFKQKQILWKTELTRSTGITGSDSKKQSKWNYWQS